MGTRTGHIVVPPFQYVTFRDDVRTVGADAGIAMFPQQTGVCHRWSGRATKRAGNTVSQECAMEINPGTSGHPSQREGSA